MTDQPDPRPACGHEWVFLEHVIVHHPDVWKDGWPKAYAWNERTHDRYYCRRCLAYRDRPLTKAAKEVTW